MIQAISRCDFEMVKELLSSVCVTPRQVKKVRDAEGNTVLHLACQVHRLDIVRCLLEQGKADVEATNNQKCTPLHIASALGLLSIVQYIVEHGQANVDVTDKGRVGPMCNTTHIDDFSKVDGRTPLHYATICYHPDVVRYLVERGRANINATDSNHMSTLHMAAYQGHLDLVQYMIECGAVFDGEASNVLDERCRDRDGCTALHIASNRGHLEVVRYLVGQSGEYYVNDDDHKIRTALLHACQEGHFDVARYLIEDCDFFHDRNYRKALLYALSSERTNLELIRYLIGTCENSADDEDYYGIKLVQIAEEKGLVDVARRLLRSSPLQIACGENKLETVRKMIELENADIEEPDTQGRTPLYYAANGCHQDIVRYLVERRRANTEVSDDIGQSILHVASAKGNIEVIKILVEEGGANVEVCNEYGQRPLHCATRAGHAAVVRYLLNECGAAQDQTLLYLACEEGHLEVLQILDDENKPNATNDVDNEVYEANVNGDTDSEEEEEWSSSSSRNDGGISPSDIAARNGHAEVVRYMLDHYKIDKRSALLMGRRHLEVCRVLIEEGNADIEDRSPEGNTTFLQAVADGHLDIVRYLAEDCQANVKARNEKTGNGALHLAAFWNNLDIIKYLMEAKLVDVDATNTRKQTALHVASEKNHLSIVRYLVEECGAGVSALDNDGWRAIHVASASGSLAVLQYLIGSGITEQYYLNVSEEVNDRVNQYMQDLSNLESISSYRTTALHIASAYGQLEVVKFLVGRDQVANVELKDSNGQTALHVASANGRKEIVQWLLESGGADIEQIDKDGLEAIDLARKGGHADVLELLTGIPTFRKVPFWGVLRNANPYIYKFT